MKFDLLTIFPNFFDIFLETSIIKRAIDNNLIEINIHNLRDYSKLKGNKIDDTPYGGGVGMVMAFPPFYRAIKKIKNKNTKVVLLSPQGKIFDHALAIKLAKEKNLLIISGHYEGIDNRVLDYVDYEISIGDYILTGGEIASMVIIDSVTRLVDGVINKESVESDSLYNGLLKYPQYTKPYSFKNKKVPDVLISGDHKKIDEWRFENSILQTLKKRKDLIPNIKDEKLLEEIKKIANKYKIWYNK